MAASEVEISPSDLKFRFALNKQVGGRRLLPCANTGGRGARCVGLAAPLQPLPWPRRTGWGGACGLPLHACMRAQMPAHVRLSGGAVRG